MAALSSIIFIALLESFEYSLRLINTSRAKLSALSVANDRMEYFRSLPYDDVGTISGIPSGTVPQNSIVTLNGIRFYERVLVEYVDDPADGEDGTGIPDNNGIPADYKRVKLEYTWSIGGATSSIAMISNIVPRSVETTAGGGTVRVNVIDDVSMLLPGASVRLINNTTTSTIDVTRITDTSGSALFSGAPAASNYEVIVTGNIAGHDYSTAQTYKATTTNPNPIVSPFSVLESDVSTLTFQIGKLSDLSVTSLSAVSEGSFVEGFSDLTGVATSSQVVTNGGMLVLEDTTGVYKTSGYAFLGPISPSPLLNWQTVRVAADVPTHTSLYVQFFTGTSSGPYTLIPDIALPGNSTGFVDSIVDISDLDTATYPDIFVGVTLATSNTGITPEVHEIGVYYRNSATVAPNISFAIHGNKTIGTTAALAPIYKYNSTFMTDAVGVQTISDLEFDSYTLTPPSLYHIAMACPAHPFVQQAGFDGELELLLAVSTATSTRIAVVDSLGDAIPGATVHLTRSGYNMTKETDGCGQAFFTGGGLVGGFDYTLDVSAVGYNNNSIDPYAVSRDTSTVVTLTEL